MGGDQFERVEAGSLPPSNDEVDKVSPRERCRASLVEILGGNDGNPVTCKELERTLETQGEGRATIFRALKELVEEGEVVQPTAGQYALNDPFA